MSVPTMKRCGWRRKRARQAGSSRPPGATSVRGGGDRDPRSGFNYNTVEAYDPTTNTWTTKAPMPTPRSHMAAGVVNDIIYVVGGSDGSTDLATVDLRFAIAILSRQGAGAARWRVLMRTRWWISMVVVLGVVGVATESRAQARISPMGPSFSIGGIGSAGASITGSNIGVTSGGLNKGLDLSINNKIYRAPSVNLRTSPPVSIRPTDDGRLRTRFGTADERTVNRATISMPAAGGGPPPGGGHGGETPHVHVHTSGDDGEQDCYFYRSDQHWHCYKVKK